MLTADLVRAYRKGGELRITSWRGDARDRALSLAEGYLAIAEDFVGRTRGELFEAMNEIPVGARDRKLADGLRKLVLDRCELEAAIEVSPIELRAEVFQRAAELRRTSDRMELDRDAVLAEVAAQRGIAADELDRLLFADLKDAHRLLSFSACQPAHLLAEYELSQIQAVLLRAERVVVHVECTSAATYRYLFRQLKFHRLLHRIEREDQGYRISIDGPFSLFSGVTKYGLQLAMLVPALRTCDRWALRAELCWGKDRARLSFQTEGTRSAEARDPALSEDVAALFERLTERFQSGKSGWEPAQTTEIFDLPGVGLCVPDLVLSRSEDGVSVYVEVLGYWSRAAVWKRVELMERGLGQPIVFVVPERLRVSEEVLPNELPAALYVYKGVIHPKSLEERAQVVAERFA